ncbi:MAG TPA: hypothetical protein VFZ61_02260, partial [Polyangiales bacterium]
DAVVCSFQVGNTGSGQANFDRLRVVLDRDGDATTLANDSLLSSSAYTLSGNTLTLSTSACSTFRDAVSANGKAAIRVVVPCAQSNVPGNDGGVADSGMCVPAAEVCDDVDNDCDGFVDEGCDIIIF